MSDTDSSDAHVTRAQDLLGALIARPDCAVLADLISLRGQGWESKSLDGHFSKQRHTNETDRSSDTDQKWLNMMSSSMHQMNKSTRFIRAKRFIDIGCCPGGYSTYILRACPEATGVGISLPFEQGGHGLAISPDLLPRIKVHMMDITQFDLAPSAPKILPTPTSTLTTIPFTPHTFDLVVCDGHHLRINPDNTDRPWNWTRLLISQLLLGLRAVSTGGTVFIKLSHPEKPIGARILLALCRVSNLVRTVKPKTMHAIRGTFYVIAQGVCVGSEECRALESVLEELSCIMSFEGENGYGRCISYEEEDLITSWDEVMSEAGQENLARLGSQVWEIQHNALRKFLYSRGV